MEEDTPKKMVNHGNQLLKYQEPDLTSGSFWFKNENMDDNEEYLNYA